MRKLGVMVAAAAVVAAATGWTTAEQTAGTVEVVGTQLRFTAHDGVENSLEILSAGAGKVQLREQTGPVGSLSPECTADPAASGPWTVTCDVTAVDAYLLDGGDMKDVLLVRDPMSVRLVGGIGADQLYGNGAADVLDGGSGNDVLDGGGGNDLFIGGPGDDLIVGSAMRDSLFGGEGADTLLGGAGFDHLDGGTGPATGNARDICYPGPDGAATRNCEVVR